MASLLDPARMVPLSLPPVRAAAVRAAAAATLPLTMELQEQTNWCWSAVATSTARYYDPQSTWTQCAVVNAELGVAMCCENGGDAACNQPWYLDRALGRVGRFGVMANSKATWEAVTHEIDERRPLGVRIAWNGGGGHFVVVSGYETGAETIDVRDPWFGDSSVSHAVFPDTYQTGGSWTHSYTTR